MEVGLIGEGVTDQITIENILCGYFQDKNLTVNYLQPKPDESGNWDKVFKYCNTNEFKQALPFNDILIIQVDTDFLRTGDVPDDLKIAVKDMNVEQIVDAVKAKLIEKIGVEFYEENSQIIIFAIAVDQIECWLLPIYFASKPKIAAKMVNCLDTLNTILFQKEGFYIDKKNEEYYRTISKNFHKKKTLLIHASKNPSFKIFIDELDKKIRSADEHQ